MKTTADRATYVRLETEAIASSPDDLRARGWAVAVHNDYRLDGEPHTFWLFTKGDACVKGEGRTDAEALNQIRASSVVAAVLDGPSRREERSRALLERATRDLGEIAARISDIADDVCGIQPVDDSLALLDRIEKEATECRLRALAAEQALRAVQKHARCGSARPCSSPECAAGIADQYFATNAYGVAPR